MTSSKSSLSALALAVLMMPGLSFAGLGAYEGGIDGEGIKMRAFRSKSVTPQYAMHEMKSADGSRVRQYAAPNGRIFAVTWNTQYKPDMNALLGLSHDSYAAAVKEVAKRGGIQRSMRHDTNDLYVQSNSHLHFFSGYAYLKSQTPQGFNKNTLTSE
jgi:hypothetical protein